MSSGRKYSSDNAPASWPARVECYRPHLLSIAACKVRARWRSKLAASDLVQQTLLEATIASNGKDLPDVDLLRWLRRILANNLHDARRRFDADKRAVGREVSLHKSRLLRAAPSLQETPSATALQREQNERLDRAIASLPSEQQRIIQLRHAEDRRFADIADLLGVSENAAQKLWTRALDSLRRRMRETE
jgi:RNA polymerase sigma-70 factor (ECF subfamily)